MKNVTATPVKHSELNTIIDMVQDPVASKALKIIAAVLAKEAILVQEPPTKPTNGTMTRSIWNYLQGKEATGKQVATEFNMTEDRARALLCMNVGRWFTRVSRGKYTAINPAHSSLVHPPKP